MKKILLLFLLLLIINLKANSQCTIPNGSFEDWSQQEFNYETTNGTTLSGSALMPVGFQSMFTYQHGLEVLSLGDSADYENFENNTQDFFGIARSEDATHGSYALKLYRNESTDFTDFLGVYSCNAIPDSFSFDLEHVGTSLDTFTIQVIWDKGLNLGLDFEENEPNAGNGDVYAFEFGPKSHHKLNIVKLNEDPVDTFTLYMKAKFENFKNSYIVIDNLELHYSTSSKNNYKDAVVEVTPNPTRGDINVISNIQNGSHVTIIDAIGRLITKLVCYESVNIDLSDHSAGIYHIIVSDNSGNVVKTNKVILIR